MKNLHYIIVIIVLIILNGILLIKGKSNDEQTNIGELNRIEKLYCDKFIIEKESENLILDGNLQLLNLDGDTILVREIFTDNKIVFRYSLMNCGDCVDAEFEILLKELQSNLNNNIELCLFAYYNRIRDLVIDHRNFLSKGLDIPIYLIPNNSLGIPIDEQNLPYYFHIDSNLVMNNFFIPLKNQPNLTRAYLRVFQ